MIAEDLNKIIIASEKTKELDPNDISDGYHTFRELYDHRIALFISYANFLYKAFLPFAEDTGMDLPWKSKLHSDGTMFEGWFVAGIGKKKGEQITYHLPLDKWDLLHVDEIKKAPEWDGHTPADVIKRLMNI